MLNISDITLNKLEAGRLEEQLPELYALRSCVENFPPWHTNESVYDHTIATLEELEDLFKTQDLQGYLSFHVNKYTKKDLLYLATVLHDIGKPKTLIRLGKETRCSNHEIVSAIKAGRILPRFGLSPNENRRVLQIIRSHGFFCVTSHEKNPERDYEILRKGYEKIFLDMLLFEMADTKALRVNEEGKRKQQQMIGFYQKQIDEFLAA